MDTLCGFGKMVQIIYFEADVMILYFVIVSVFFYNRRIFALVSVAYDTAFCLMSYCFTFCIQDIIVSNLSIHDKV